MRHGGADGSNPFVGGCGFAIGTTANAITSPRHPNMPRKEATDKWLAKVPGFIDAFVHLPRDRSFSGFDRRAW